ncbi:MAG TPA: alpha/beta fold hydrolase, partial [Acidimicrobiia bacterium]|nr:alpha/beta fold hydrolase [Acidimicrobiia bacterium]
MEALPVRRHPGATPAIVALHGFTQHGGMFTELATELGREILAPDLPGHGDAAAVHATFSGAVEAVAAMVDGRPLLGYSQGGRIALGVALEHPGAVSRLVLISAGIGIPDKQRRSARQASDEVLARNLEREGLDA